MSDLTQGRLKEALDYNPMTGLFTWLERRSGVKHGSTAGCIEQGRYCLIRLDGLKHYAHRLAWFYTHGTWPESQIDHVNGDKLDNRIGNLRQATPLENSQNQPVSSRNTSGHIGVVWHKPSGKWIAQIKVRGRCHSLGYYYKKEDAVRVRQKAEIEFGFHENHGRKV